MISDHLKSKQSAKDSKKQKNELLIAKRLKRVNATTSRVFVHDREGYSEITIHRLPLYHYLTGVDRPFFIFTPFLIFPLGIMALVLDSFGIHFLFAIPVALFLALLFVRLYFPTVAFQVTDDGFCAFCSNKFFRKKPSLGDKKGHVSVALGGYSKYNSRRGTWDTRYGWNYVSFGTETGGIGLSAFYHVHKQDVQKLERFFKKHKVSVSLKKIVDGF